MCWLLRWAVFGIIVKQTEFKGMGQNLEMTLDDVESSQCENDKRDEL